MRKLSYLIVPALFALGLNACGQIDENNGNGTGSGTGSSVSTGSDTGSSTGSSTGATVDTGTGTGSDTGSGTGTDTTPPAPVEITVDADITADTTWPAGSIVTLKKHIFVLGGTLTIGEGATVKGSEGTSLVITPAGRINAVGTVAKPIVFTSAKAVGSRAAGNWGGVVLLGKAPINVSGGTNKIEGFPAGTANTEYGGTDAAHDCGTIKYARIEFAGFQLAPDNELNSLTVAGCGTKTEIDYVQTLRGADDGVEMFGGTANLKHILVSQANDDGLDWDFGWNGKVQYLIVQQSEIDGDRAFESDSNKNTPDATPRSNPTIYNATLVGSGKAKGGAPAQGAMHLRRGTAGQMYNFVITKFSDRTIDVDGSASVKQAKDGGLFIKNSIIFGNVGGDQWPAESKDAKTGLTNDASCTLAGWDKTTVCPEANIADFDEGKFFTDAALNNADVDPMLTDMSSLTKPNFAPKAGSPALTGGATPPNDGFFNTAATFRGAVGSTDWTAGWTAFPEN